MNEGVQMPEKEESTWFGYRFVGDNIDKNIQPSFQRQGEHSVQSLHYFHGYAVRDRVNLTTYSDDIPPFITPDPSILLPSVTDLSLLKEELTVLISRLVTIL